MPDASQQEPATGLEVSDLASAVLKGVALTVAAGQGRAIVGPSGSGKTSLFRAIADLDPGSGAVALAGRPRESFTPGEWRSRVAYVPAEPAWWLSKAGDHADAEARRFAERLGLGADLLAKPVKSLSTGERQRLALAIAFARRPDALLLDEPTSALDDENRDDVEAAILERLADGAALLIASHDMGQVERLGLDVVHMADGRLDHGGEAP
jgi:phosphate-transporting ATPase